MFFQLMNGTLEVTLTPSKMLDKWDVDWDGENNIRFNFYDYGYANKTSGSGWREHSVWYRED